MNTPPTQPALYTRMAGDDRSIAGSLFRATTAIAEPFYRLAVNARNRGYDTGKRPVHRAHCPVISIGNITTGGTGKTPMVAHVVRELIAMNRCPAVLTRGYKSTEQGSDEAKLLGAELPNVPIIVNPDRVAAAKQVKAKHSGGSTLPVSSDLPGGSNLPGAGVDVLVLDDGFQHRRIGRDLDIVLIDATNPWGFGHVLPRGLLREPLAGLRRADAVIITRCDQVGADALAAIEQGIIAHHGKPALDRAAHRWRTMVDQHDVEQATLPQPLPEREGGDSPTVVAVCGLGNPGPFFQQVAERYTLAHSVTFADHHAYTQADAAALRSLVTEHHADALITTEKDWVKLQHVIQSADWDRPIWRPRLALHFADGGDTLRQRLTETLDTWTHSSN